MIYQTPMIHFEIVGAILGVQDGRNIELKDSFAVPLESEPGPNCVVNESFFKTRTAQCGFSSFVSFFQVFCLKLSYRTHEQTTNWQFFSIATDLSPH